MRQTTGTRKSPGEKIVKDIKRATRKHCEACDLKEVVAEQTPKIPAAQKEHAGRRGATTNEIYALAKH